MDKDLEAIQDWLIQFHLSPVQGFQSSGIEFETRYFLPSGFEIPQSCTVEVGPRLNVNLDQIVGFRTPNDNPHDLRAARDYITTSNSLTANAGWAENQDELEWGVERLYGAKVKLVGAEIISGSNTLLRSAATVVHTVKDAGTLRRDYHEYDLLRIVEERHCREGGTSTPFIHVGTIDLARYARTESLSITNPAFTLETMRRLQSRIKEPRDFASVYSQRQSKRGTH